MSLLHEIIPETFEEAVSRVCIILRNQPMFPYNHLNEDRFVSYLHSNFGMSMRNVWGLWDKDSSLYHDINKKYKIEHADDMSGLILHAAYCRIHNIPFDPNNKAKEYITYWKEMSRQQKTIRRLTWCKELLEIVNEKLEGITKRLRRREEENK